MTKDQLLKNARSLPKGEQIDLALELWESIDADSTEPPVTDAIKRELDRRIAADDADEQAAVQWPELKDKLLKGEF